jgi:hypothetical protein
MMDISGNVGLDSVGAADGLELGEAEAAVGVAVGGLVCSGIGVQVAEGEGEGVVAVVLDGLGNRTAEPEPVGDGVIVEICAMVVGDAVCDATRVASVVLDHPGGLKIGSEVDVDVDIESGGFTGVGVAESCVGRE